MPLPKRETRNSDTLDSFVQYCEEHPDQRFWQALLNWSGVPFILISSKPAYVVNNADGVLQDPYNWEGRNG